MKKQFFLMATAAIALASCSNEELIEAPRNTVADSITFRALVDHSADSRSIETELTSLHKFRVTAIEGDTSLFTNLLFERKDTSVNEYVSNPVYQWSKNMILNFYAVGYGTTNPEVDMTFDFEDEGNLVGEVTIDPMQKTINNFRVQPQIKDQIDLVFARTTSGQTPLNGSVQLTFDHILSEIEVRATCSSTEHQIEVKGIKYGNIDASGNFDIDAYINHTQDPWTENAKDKMDFEVPVLDTPVTLSSTSVALSQTGKVGWAVVVPQELTTYGASTQYWAGTNPGGKTKATCAYVALLIKVTALENGSPTAVKFPTAKDNPDADGFAWAYIPFHTDEVSKWEPGKRYIYHINFDTGAGFNEEGDKILDHDIKFSASVNPWSDVNVNKNIESSKKPQQTEQE